MAITLAYPDKYRLWSDLVRGNREHLFIATEDTPRLGKQAEIEVRVAQLSAPLTLQGVIVGRRPASARFPAGVYVSFSLEALERCMRFLGLGTLPAVERRARQARRIHCALPIQVVDPPLSQRGSTKNISQTGVFMVIPGELVPSQRITIELSLPDETLRMRAEVVWADVEQHAFGLEFEEPAEPEADKLHHFISHLAERERAARTGPAPVLVADDDPEVLRLVRTALTKQGFEVYHATTGSEALRLARQLGARLVLLDILMPGIDGAEVCKTMRGDAELVEVPIVFVSALAPEALHQVASEAGASDYLSKPLHLRDLIDMVSTYLGLPPNAGR